LNRLDDALQSVLGNPVADLYPEAVALFDRFRGAKNRGLIPSPQEDFEKSIAACRLRSQRVPCDGRTRAEFLIHRLLGAEPEIEVLIDLKSWLEGEYP
jgi:hypothetical protein